MKRIVSFILMLCMLCTALPHALAQNPITVYVDNVAVIFDTDPVIENDRTLVPMRAIFEALGATVAWEPESRTAVAEQNGTTVRITIDDITMLKNDAPILLEAPAKLISDRTYVPVRAISEALGKNVDWDDKTSTVIITDN